MQFSSTYLRQIGQYPLLTKELEVELAERMQLGRDTAVALGVDPADLAAAVGRSRVIRRAHDARTTFINANLRLVVAEVKKVHYTNLDAMDLVQAGNQGLMKAVDRFDGTRGFRFSTFAVDYIQQSIRETAGDTQRTIRLPGNAQRQLKSLREARATLLDTLGREPTDVELAEAAGLRVDHVRRLWGFLTPAASLSDPLNGEEPGASLVDKVAEPFHANAYTSLETNELALAVSDVMRHELTPKEYDVLRRRLGFDGPAQCLEDLADELSMSRDRLRVLERRACSKLRPALEARGWSNLI